MSQWHSVNKVVLTIHVISGRFLCEIVTLVREEEQDKTHANCLQNAPKPDLGFGHISQQTLCIALRHLT